jgi:amino acid adenylation domain-containing protein
MEPRRIHCLFERAAERFPDRIAVSAGSGEITYRELNERSERLAQVIKSKGEVAWRVVGVYMEQSIDYVVAVLGILKAEAVFIPLDVRFPNARLSAILTKTDPSLIFTDTRRAGEFRDRLRKIDAGSIPVVTVDETVRFTDGAADRNKSDHVPGAANRDHCYLMTTSGSTGEPKAILGSHRGLCHFVDWEIREFALHERTRVSFLSHVAFDVSLRDIFVPLLCGGALCIPDEDTKRNPRVLYEWLATNKITLTHIVPTLFRLVTEAVQTIGPTGEVLPSLEYVLIAGETLYGDDVINWQKVVGHRAELVNIYGPSETTLAKLFYRIPPGQHEPREVIPLGRPIPDTDVLVMSEGGLCHVGEIGEIYIGTPYRSYGYYNDAALTRSVFVPNPRGESASDTLYRTGDLGKWLPDGNLQFVGRVDGQIKLHGQRVEIQEIEAALRQHEEIKQVAVTLDKGATDNQRLVAYVVAKTGRLLPVEPLRRFAADRLPEYMVPSLYVQLESLPLTHSGKVDRTALPEPPMTRPPMEQAFTSPSSSVEKTLVGVWRQVLGFDQIGVDDNFFDLGGTSILATRLAAMVQSELGTELPVVKVFQYPKISLMANYLGQGEDRQEVPGYIVDRAHRRRKVRMQQRRSRMK